MAKCEKCGKEADQVEEFAGKQMCLRCKQEIEQKLANAERERAVGMGEYLRYRNRDKSGGHGYYGT